MGEAVQLSGTLTAGPTGSSDSAFPGGVTNLPLTLSPAARPYNVATGPMVRNVVTSAGVFQTLDGVPNTVSQATFLYFRSTQPMLLRKTRVEPSAADVVTVEAIQGVHMMEYDPSRYLKLLEISGTGYIEYFVSGNQ